jgi:hypothetical protein
VKKLLIVSLVCAIVATIYAACPEPAGLPTCAAGTQMNGAVSWPCCDQTKACPADGTKWARFYREMNAHALNGIPICVFPSTQKDYGTEKCQCCGDTVAPGPNQNTPLRSDCMVQPDR